MRCLRKSTSFFYNSQGAGLTRDDDCGKRLSKKTLTDNICILLKEGHRDCLNYGYGYAVECIEAIYRNQTKEVELQVDIIAAGVANGIGLAFGGRQKGKKVVHGQ